MAIQVLNDFPPNWKQIEKVFPKAKDQKAVFAYGNTTYNPFGAEITEDIKVHEAVHTKQQGEDPQSWWDKYCSDPNFRVKQEAEAYSSQVYYLRNIVKQPSRVIEWYIEKIAQTLSGPLYGNIITLPKAKTLIRKQLQRWT